MIEAPLRTYVFVRKDLPLADQLVQVGHVCLLAGALFPQHQDTHLVLLEVPDQQRLVEVTADCRQKEIRIAAFEDPDPPGGGSSQPMGLTALCTEPLEPTRQRLLRRYRLWIEYSTGDHVIDRSLVRHRRESVQIQ